ncbi:MAG: hypothetical protein ACTSWY_12990 [Promethearchaeota archaeon]
MAKKKKSGTKKKKSSEKSGKKETKKEIKEVIEAQINRIDYDKSEAPKMPEKFWQKGAFTALMDPSLVDSKELVKYDLSSILSEFTKKMLEEEIIDFRISGMAIYSTAKLYHKKIKDVIDEEEKVQIRELREKARREIPKAMPQPLRESRKIATSDELFGAMRAAIIETMQKRELLRIRRDKNIEKKEELKILRAKGQLPEEILKHILGKKKTTQEILQSWFETIRAKIKLNDKKRTSYGEICRDIIEIEEKDHYGQKLRSIEFFIALLFLSTDGKINLSQDTDFDNIQIEIPRHIM